VTTNYTLTLNENNDEVVKLTITNADTGAPYPLTGGVVVNMYLKTTENTPDSDPSTVTLSSSGGQITITDANNGICQAAVPATALAVSGAKWWRADVVGPGGKKTASYGNLNVRPL
jgi:hypothetical protein